ncbi:hypothetical protein A8A01_01310 [Ewingella americana]|nr:hypothetical protein A8A01_01310 [Ewingella americana]
MQATDTKRIIPEMVKPWASLGRVFTSSSDSEMDVKLLILKGKVAIRGGAGKVRHYRGKPNE